MNAHITNKSIFALILTLASATNTIQTTFSPTKGGEWAIRATVAGFFAYYFANSHDWKGVIPNRTDETKQSDEKSYLGQVLQSDEYDTQEKWDSVCQWIMQNRKDLAFMASAPYALQAIRSNFTELFDALDPRGMFVEEPQCKPKC